MILSDDIKMNLLWIWCKHICYFTLSWRVLIFFVFCCYCYNETHLSLLTENVKTEKGIIVINIGIKTMLKLIQVIVMLTAMILISSWLSGTQLKCSKVEMMTLNRSNSSFTSYVDLDVVDSNGSASPVIHPTLLTGESRLTYEDSVCHYSCQSSG